MSHAVGPSSRAGTALPPLRLALFQPDIPQNAGTLMRLGACLDVPVALIEPAGFPAGDRAFRRAGMDYLDRVRFERHASFAAFETWRREAGLRLLAASTRGRERYLDVAFRQGDVLLLGPETAGLPAEVLAVADLTLRIPQAPGLRSINVALAGAMLAGEALRQLAAFPDTRPEIET